MSTRDVPGEPGRHAGEALSDVAAVVAQAPTLGAALAGLREAAGLTVEQVAARTCIRGTLIRDLEADRYASSGAPVYARGHLRNISGVLGIDGGPLVARFDRDVADETPPMPVVDAVVVPPTSWPGFRLPSAVAPERRGPNWAVAGVAALGALVAIIAVGTVAGSGSGPDRLDAGVGIGATPSSPLPTVSAQPLPSAATAEVPAFDGADLRIRLIGGPSWVQVRNDQDATLFEGVLQAGQSKDFRYAGTLMVKVGNAGAVSLVCSGKDLARAGSDGKIARFTCSDSGLVSA